jgi:inhibitor of KinA sporulation pathway (predicted exonuclease)
MHLRHGSFCNPITWGGGDSLCLRDQLGLAEERFLFGRRFFDVKTLYQSYQLSQGQKIANGLSKAMAKMGLNFKGRKHTADADAENTFVFFCHMLKKFRK